HKLHVVPLVVLFRPVIAAKSHRRLARSIYQFAHKVRALRGQASWIPIMAGYGLSLAGNVCFAAKSGHSPALPQRH
ncbi:MAG: hypothetical protein ABSF41_17370, partial [Pseudolabrys sp.]